MAEFKHFNELKVEEVIRCQLGVVIDIDLAVMLHSSLHKQIGAFKGRADIYNFFAVKSTNDALVGVACCNTYVDRRFNERVIFHHEILLKLYQFFLNVHCSIDGLWRLIIVVEEIGAPRCQNNESTDKSEYAIYGSLHEVDLPLDYLDHLLVQVQLLLCHEVK